MSVVNAVPLLLADDGYQISRSVRLRSSASAYFNRTLTTPTDGKKWTYSVWVKRGILTAGTGTAQQLLSAGSATAFFRFSTTDTLVSGWTGAANLETTQVFRDPSAWYHIMLVVDTTQATASNRVKYYVNGTQITAFATTDYPTQNSTTTINSAVAHNIGAYTSSTQYLDGYLTEVNFIDGQALTPSSFGETNTVTGVWQPKKYAGTYGTNGFFLNFSDNSAATAAAIGKDYSGNGNNWTPNNISVTAGVTYDSMLDVPTPWADGGNGRGNYAVINPLDRSNGGNAPTMSNGNLSAAAPANPTHFWSTIALPVGSADGWYWEGICTSMDTARTYIGIIDPVTTGASPGASYAFVDKAIIANTGVYYNTASGTGGTGGTTFTSYAANDVVMVAYKNGKIWFGKNGTWMNSGDPAAGTGAVDSAVAITKEWKPYFGYNSSWTANFGQRPFSYTPPSGFKALNTLNLPAPTILKGNQYFDAVTYAGSASQQTITTSLVGLDFAWIKNRTTARDHVLVDTVRGGSPLLTLYSDLTAAEDNSSPNYNPTSFTTSGIVLGGAKLGINNAGENFVLWGWKEGATQGFDIVTYTGTGSGTTVAHNLGVAPSWVIIKQRSASGNYFVVWARGTTSTSQALWLGATNAVLSTPNYWNSTAPTASVFSVGTDSATNGSGSTYVAYLFSEVAGFSRFGSYTGNGSSDGPFVFCGFRPRFVMIKGSSFTSNWFIQDGARNGYNVNTGVALRPNLSNAEDGTTFYDMDLLSNGFKLRTSTGDSNSSGATFIFAAFAENPFKNSLAR